MLPEIGTIKLRLLKNQILIDSDFGAAIKLMRRKMPNVNTAQFEMSFITSKHAKATSNPQTELWSEAPARQL